MTNMIGNLNKLIELNFEIEGLLLILSNRGDEAPAHVWSMLNEKFHACQLLLDEICPIVASMPIECKPAERQPIAQRKEQHNDNNKKHNELNIDKKPSLTVDEMLQQRDSQDLRKAFTLNDMFRFKRELFGNSESDFTDTLNVISAMNSLSEAIEYFYDDLGWNSENEEVKDFIFIISSHFNSKQQQ